MKLKKWLYYYDFIVDIDCKIKLNSYSHMMHFNIAFLHTGTAFFFNPKNKMHMRNLLKLCMRESVEVNALLYVAFRLACRFDGDFCTTAQAPLAAEERPSGEER